MRTKPIISLIGPMALTLGICAVAGQDAEARHLTPDEALSKLGTAQLKSPSAAPLKLAYTGRAADEAAVYVFDRATAPGFVILAADDAVGDIVLGYSDDAAFDADSLSPGLKWILGAYSHRVAACAAGQAAPGLSKAPAAMQRVEPLLSTKWNQRAPFNDLCPVISSGPSVSGCVSTAVAQVMKKHKWPLKGSGSLTYQYRLNFGGGDIRSYTVSSDFGAHTYDWDNMLDDYTGAASATQKAAVAQLVFDCGVAAETTYQGGAASASTFDAARGMIEYFDYDKSMQFLQREFFSTQEWIRMMYEQVAQGMPVLYSGNDVGNKSGHAFVLDGYDGEGYFHVNWGWGGLADGYYSLSNLVPTQVGVGGGLGDYNFDQDAVVNIRPNIGSAAAPVFAIQGSFMTEKTEYAASGVTVYFTAGDDEENGFFSYSLVPVNVQVGVMNTADGGVLSLNPATKEPLSGYGGFGFGSQSFPRGEYDVYPVYKITGGEWTQMLHKEGTPARLHFVNNGSTIKVNPVTVATATVALSTSALELTEGEAYQLEAVVTPADATDQTLTWVSSDAAVATVDASGRVTAVAPGTATITASCGKVSASCTVTVKPLIIAAESIALNTEAVELTEGEAFRLEAVVMPYNTTDKTVTWVTSDPSVATVNDEGVITAVRAGTATVTASCGAASASCAVTVKPLIIAAESIALNSEAVELVEGDKFRLEAVVTPDNATDKTVTWVSSDPTVATVDADGMITAVAPGSAIITASCGAASASCAVAVRPLIIAAESIALNSEAVELVEGDKFRLEAVVTPDNATDKTVTWVSSDPAVATVDADGLVTAVAEGTAVITASCGTASASCAVAVKPLIIAAEGIALNCEAVELEEGDTFSLVAVVTPENTTDKTVTWVSSDPAVATVDADGRVTAVAEGTAVITAGCGTASASCAVTVKTRGGIAGVESDAVGVRIAGGCVYVQAADDAVVAIYDEGGMLRYIGTDHVIPVEARKCYIIVVGDKVFKVKA